MNDSQYQHAYTIMHNPDDDISNNNTNQGRERDIKKTMES